MLHDDGILCPEEQMLWEAYYCIEPFTGELLYLAQIEAAIRRLSKPILPLEAMLNNPLEDKLATPQAREHNAKSIARLLTQMADDYFISSGQPTVDEQLAVIASSGP